MRHHRIARSANDDGGIAAGASSVRPIIVAITKTIATVSITTVAPSIVPRVVPTPRRIVPPRVVPTAPAIITPAEPQAQSTSAIPAAVDPCTKPPLSLLAPSVHHPPALRPKTTSKAETAIIVIVGVVVGHVVITARIAVLLSGVGVIVVVGCCLCGGCQRLLRFGGTHHRCIRRHVVHIIALLRGTLHAARGEQQSNCSENWCGAKVRFHGWTG